MLTSRQARLAQRHPFHDLPNSGTINDMYAHVVGAVLISLSMKILSAAGLFGNGLAGLVLTPSNRYRFPSASSSGSGLRDEPSL